MGGCLSKSRRPLGRRSSSRSSSFCCAGVPEASLSSGPNDNIDLEEAMRWTAPPPMATGPEGLQGGGTKGPQLSPPARAILLDSFQWATASAPSVSSQLHQKPIGITTSRVMSKSMTRTATVSNSGKPTSLSSGMSVGTVGDEFAAQDWALLHPSIHKRAGKRQPSLCPGEGSSNTSPRSSLRRPQKSCPTTLEPPNTPDDMEFITNALDHPSHPVQVEGPRSEYQFTRSGGWNKITVQENGGKGGEYSGRMWWKKDGEPIRM
ncbi:hypothetical protein EV426DRAFT_702329 [Tirmania nivea]|nr:hypothetical protein EV426DRAFT_702329 [Tirmania nivea]